MATFAEEIARLQAVRAKVPGFLTDIARKGIEVAVKYAEEHTPVGNGEARATPHPPGAMRDAWRQDSQMEPEAIPNGVRVVLANDVRSPHDPAYSYASDVNDGHLMDQHYVPELGITVGVHTHYIPGLHIAEFAVDAFEQYCAKEQGAVVALIVGK